LRVTGNLAGPVLTGLKESQGYQAPLDLMDSQVSLDWMASRAWRVNQDLDYPAEMAKMVRLDLRENAAAMAIREKREILDCLDSLVLMERKVSPDQQEWRACQELMDCQELKVETVPLELMGCQDLRAWQVSQATMDGQVWMGCWGRRVTPAYLGSPDPRATAASTAGMGSQV